MKKKSKYFFPANVLIFGLCLAWIFFFVKAPDRFFVFNLTMRYTPEENDYLNLLRAKYSGTQRSLSVEETKLIIKIACDFIENSKKLKGVYNSEDAQELLFGTACIESSLRPRFQDSGGDAIGLFQVEYPTFKDLWNRAIKIKHPDLHRDIKEKFINPPFNDITFEDLQKNDVLCAIFARMKFAENDEAIPPANNSIAQAEYYKKHYNTILGKSKAKDFVKRKNEFLAEKK